MLARMTCKDAAERLMRQHDLATRAPEDYDEYTDVFSAVVHKVVDDFVEGLSDDERFNIWYTADVGDWREGLNYYGDEAGKSGLLAGLAMHCITETIGAQLRPAKPTA